MKSRIMKSGILALWIVILLAGLTCAAFAADDGVTLDLKDADIRSAIESLFRGTNRGFIIGDDVMGTVTMYMPEKQPFDIALKVLLKAKDLVYKIDNGIYVISRKQGLSGMGSGMVGGGMPGAGMAGGGIAARGAGAMGATGGVLGGSTTRRTGLDDTLEKDMIVDKIPLNYIGASEMMDILSGNMNNGNNSNNNNGGGYGGSSSGGYGGSSSGGYGSSSGSSNRGSSSSRGSSSRSSGSSSRGSSSRSGF